MGIVLPLIMFVAFLGLNATSSYYERQLSRTPPAAVAAISAQNFLTYKAAIADYMSANPAFIGSIPLSSLAPYLNGANPAMLASMSNTIIASAGSGTTMIVSAQNLAPGAAASALLLSQGDASIGRVSGGQWSSYGAPSVPTILPVPDSNLVYVSIIN